MTVSSVSIEKLSLTAVPCSNYALSTRLSNVFTPLNCGSWTAKYQCETKPDKDVFLAGSRQSRLAHREDIGGKSRKGSACRVANEDRGIAFFCMVVPIR